MSLFTGERRSATVRALIDSVVLKLGKESWEELLSKYPSLGLHFCKVLSRRLAQTDRDVSRSRTALALAMEEFHGTQALPVQDLLLRSSLLKTLDLEAIESVLSVTDSAGLLMSLSSKHPGFVRITERGNYEYVDSLREFLSHKLEQSIGRKGKENLHLRFAAHYSSHSCWGPAICHYIEAGAWDTALELIRDRGGQILEGESLNDVRECLDDVPSSIVTLADGRLARFKAEVYLRLGDPDAAIRCYQQFLAQEQRPGSDSFAAAEYYKELAQIHHAKGETGEALGCLRLGMGALEESRLNPNALQAIYSIGVLQQKSGFPDLAFRWAGRAFHMARRLGEQRGGVFQGKNRRRIGLVLALAAGWAIWQAPTPPPLDETGFHFVASLSVGVLLWVFDVFDDYIVALMLLFWWLLTGIVPPEKALAGFSQSSWFLFLGVLGMAAALTKSGLLYRVSLGLLRRIPPSYKIYTFVLETSGLLITPVLPNITGRIAVMVPTTQTIAEIMGFQPRSNGSAGLVLSAFVGFSQLGFAFLTGSTASLFGWNLLSSSAKSEFGWGLWALAAVPAAIVILFFLFFAIHFLFPLAPKELLGVSPKSLETQLEILGPMTRAERTSLVVLALVLLGWLGKSLHGIGEAWVSLGGFLIFLLAGILDKGTLKSNIDWAFLLFFGVISSLAEIVPYFKIDQLFVGFLHPVLAVASFHPSLFLIVVALLVYGVRFFLGRYPTILLIVLSLAPWVEKVGVHPGVLLLTVLISVETWFSTYQTEYYQIAYYGTEEKAFSHAQARKLMVAKLLASLLAIAVSFPYWKMLGLIH
jgi:di/tricarboxylate transporter